MKILFLLLAWLIEKSAEAQDAEAKRVVATMRRGIRRKLDELEKFKARKRYDVRAAERDAARRRREARRCRLLSVIIRARAEQRALEARRAKASKNLATRELRAMAVERARVIKFHPDALRLVS